MIFCVDDTHVHPKGRPGTIFGPIDFLKISSNYPDTFYGKLSIKSLANNHEINFDLPNISETFLRNSVSSIVILPSDIAIENNK